MSIRALLAEDHTLVRSGIRALLEGSQQLTVIGEASEGRQAVELTRELRMPVLPQPARPPDFSTLSDGSQHARNLETFAQDPLRHETDD